IMTADRGWCEDLWHFETITDQENSLLVEKQQYVTGDGCPDLVRRITYVWNGEQYAWEKSEIEPLPSDTSAVCAIQWADEADETNDQAIAILEDALADWPVVMDERWGPASADYFRLKLGMWYDLRGQPELAQQQLQTVRDNPIASEYELASNMARDYLSARQLYGLFAGCRAMDDDYSQAYQAIPFDGLGANLSVMREMWGFAAPKWWAYGADHVCDARTAFRTDVQTLSSESDEQAVMAWLNGVGVSWTAVSLADLNNDNLTDWLILTSLDNSATWWELWAFVQNEAGYTLLYVGRLYTHERPSGITYRPFQLPAGQGTMHVVVADKALTAFTLSPQGDGWRVRELLSYWGETAVTNIRFTQTDTTLSLFIAQNSVEKQYDWFSDTATFTYVASNPPTQAEQIGHIEQLIFQQSDYQEAIAQIQALLTQGIVEPQRSSNETYAEPARVEPRLRYLLGLCYELTGDADNAVAAYWQVWHDFPDNLYALSARRKLEPIAP
ncbi:MAG: tetratricopeptide repeat protein, partial [Anaerolineales bacterium]|nr:tetratricopeptide repeat protein [Anaerolineales bacterium]